MTPSAPSDRCVCVAHAHVLWCSSLDVLRRIALWLVAKAYFVRTR